MAKQKKTKEPETLADPDVSPKDLQDFLRAMKTEETEAASDNASRRKRIGEFAKDHRLNNAAFAAHRKLDKMTESQRADWFRTFDMLRARRGNNWAGLDDLFTKADEDDFEKQLAESTLAEPTQEAAE